MNAALMFARKAVKIRGTSDSYIPNETTNRFWLSLGLRFRTAADIIAF